MQIYNLSVSKTQNKTQLAAKIGNITAMVQIGSVGGALIAFIACDKLGIINIFEYTSWCEKADILVRSNMGHSPALYGLDYWCYYLYYSCGKLWANPCWKIHNGSRNRSNNSCRSNLSR